MYQKLKRRIAATLQLGASVKEERVRVCKNVDDYYGDKICLFVEK